MLLEPEIANGIGSDQPGWEDASGQKEHTSYSPPPVPPASHPEASEHSPPEYLTPREQLLRAMGLRDDYDPFSTSVSESDQAPNFGMLYVDPQPSLLESLRRTASTFVFGDYGMGKTATRLALEHILRNAPADYPTLCVTYTPRISELTDISEHQLLAYHLTAIASEIATDLIIQFLERLSDNQRRFSDDEQTALDRVIRALPPEPRRALRGAAKHISAGRANSIWRSMRPAVRYVAPTPRWQAFVQRLAQTVSAPASPLTWDRLVDDTILLGFPRIFLLIDAIDEHDIDPDAIHRVLRPLLLHLRDFQQRGVFIKCFLPTALEQEFHTHYKRKLRDLTVPFEIATIPILPPATLHQIVRERLDAASLSNASFRDLDQLQGDEIDESITARLAQLAGGSPRRMLQLASDLIDFHCTHGFQDPDDLERLWLTKTEWLTFLDRCRQRASQPRSQQDGQRRLVSQYLGSSAPHDQRSGPQTRRSGSEQLTPPDPDSS